MFQNCGILKVIMLEMLNFRTFQEHTIVKFSFLRIPCEKLIFIRFQDFQDSTIVKFRLYEYPVKRRLFWTQENNPGSSNMSKFRQTTMLCFVMDIRTILANGHSYLLIDIGPISMIFDMSLNDYSGFVGARLFQN